MKTGSKIFPKPVRAAARHPMARRQIETLEVHGLADVPVKVALNRVEMGWGKYRRGGAPGTKASVGIAQVVARGD